MQPPGLSSANRKGKRKAETREDADIRAVLTGYETELTCPMYVYPVRVSIHISEILSPKAAVICCKLNTLGIRLCD